MPAIREFLICRGKGLTICLVLFMMCLGLWFFPTDNMLEARGYASLPFLIFVIIPLGVLWEWQQFKKQSRDEERPSE